MNHHGVEYERRRDQGREHLLAMRRLWEDDEAEFHGESCDFSPSWSWPKPMPAPLPVLLGGAAGPKLFDHIAEYAQGWIPIGGRGLRESLPACARRSPSRARLRRAGDRPQAVEPDPGKLDHYQSLGCTEIVFDLLPKPRRRGPPASTASPSWRPPAGSRGATGPVRPCR